jgi:RNA polymerase sigma-70 factor (ECF subfamily)
MLTAEGPVRAEGPLEAQFRANARYVHSIALRILGREEEVEDLLQDLFIAAKSDLREMNHPAAVRQWFVTATVRLARRRLQRRRFFSFFGQEDHAYEDAVAPGANPEQKALLSSIYRILDRLPVASRLAWTLRHIEGLPLDEVATLCKCSLATAKRRIAAAHEVIEEAVQDA